MVGGGKRRFQSTGFKTATDEVQNPEDAVQVFLDLETVRIMADPAPTYQTITQNIEEMLNKDGGSLFVSGIAAFGLTDDPDSSVLAGMEKLEDDPFSSILSEMDNMVVRRFRKRRLLCKRHKIEAMEKKEVAKKRSKEDKPMLKPKLLELDLQEKIYCHAIHINESQVKSGICIISNDHFFKKLIYDDLRRDKRGIKDKVHTGIPNGMVPVSMYRRLPSYI